MITISEVENRGKRSTKSIVAGIVACAVLDLLFSPPALCAETPPAPDGTSLEKLGDCNWQVTYRGHVYDLSPLTRASLSRPIENDIRFVLQRVPEAGAKLDAMTAHLHDAKIHSYLASFFLGAFLIAKLLEKHSMINDTDHDNFHTGEAAAGGFFLGATLFSWRNTVSAKEDLVGAVDEFNARSPYKIEPAVGRTIEPAVGRPIEMPVSGSATLSASDGTTDLPTTGSPPAATSPGRN